MNPLLRSARRGFTLLEVMVSTAIMVIIVLTVVTIASDTMRVYDRAVAVVRRERKASTSLLQRKLNIGYGRAARMIDRMEEEGIIGPDRGAGKPREVYAAEE